MQFLIVDDHALIREALRAALSELHPDAAIREAATGRDAMRLLADDPNVELVLLDLGLPDVDGFILLADLRDRHPGLPVAVLSARQDRDSVTRALDLGAVGFIPKAAPRPVMLAALNLIFVGGIYVPPEILPRDEKAPDRESGEVRPRSPSDLGLTDRQIDVLDLVLQGQSNKAIGRNLDLAETTVKNHVTAILRTLRVATRAEAIVSVNRLGWPLPLVRPTRFTPSPRCPDDA
jgi:DNA-binding NarL/FixJ family response regulator